MNIPTYDPVSTAQQLATAYTSSRQALLDAQTKTAQNTNAALSKLQSALSDFDNALNALSDKKGVVAWSAAFSDTAIGTATAKASAAAGTYSFFVEQLATANQIAYDGLSSVPVGATDTMTVSIGGLSFNVDLAAADSDGDGNLSAKEIAAAVNAAPDNKSLVTASCITVNGVSQLVLTANATGADNAISLDLGGVASGALQTALASGKQLAAAQDAIVWLGAKDTGVRLQQASNTFSAIDGVGMTFNKAMNSGDAPVTLTVGRDDNATVANVQALVDSYNKLKGVLDSLTAAGDSKNNVAAGIFVTDSGVRSLRERLNAILHESVGGVSLVSYGVTAARDGSLTLDTSRLKTKFASNPAGLNSLFGSTSITAKSGLLGDLDSYVKQWTNSVNGQITQRKAAVSKLQSSLIDRQAVLDSQFNSAYQRYLVQFTQLQSLQSQLTQTSTMFDALFGQNNSK